MVKKKVNKQSRQGKVTDEDHAEPYGVNEVDDFASKREKILLEESTLGNTQRDDEATLDDEEEEVLAVSDESSSEEDYEDQDEQEEEPDEELDGEQAYRKVFGRNLKLHEVPAEGEEGGMLNNETAWGTAKGEYYGADDLDDEETAKEIEREALRQKKKHLEDLNMNDYLDDELEEEWTKSAKEFDVGEFKDSTQQNDTNVSIKDILNMDTEAKKNYLQTLFPEFLPLCKELTQLSDVLVDLKSQEDSEIISLKIMALSGYLGTLSSYFGILLHELNNNQEFSTMKNHPVMEMILTSKEVWRQACDLPNSFGVEEEESEEEEDEEEITKENRKLNTLTVRGSDVLEDEEEEEKEEEQQEEDDDVDLDDFEDYVAQSRLSMANKEGRNVVDASRDLDDYVETEMADVDAQEKKARRRTLRFYTSKIDQQQNKKIDKFKGDDDIPYKERFFERQQRLLEEARKRGLHDSNGADLDAQDYGPDDEKVSKSVNNEGEKDYFNLIQKNRQNKKDARLQAHKNAVKASKEGKLSQLAEEIGDSGKRAINYQILKNKGLTPRRKKDNRNSRVKKRKKYEKAQKKLKSVRAVYSGGSSGVYEGEKTGIKKNLIKSVKFRN